MTLHSTSSPNGSNISRSSWSLTPQGSDLAISLPAILAAPRSGLPSALLASALLRSPCAQARDFHLPRLTSFRGEAGHSWTW
jgi:hypothetical protein